MAKPSYYIWIDKSTNIDDIKGKMLKLNRSGFNVIIFNNNETSSNEKHNFNNIIRSHIKYD